MANNIYTKARLWEPVEQGEAVRCKLCSQFCLIDSGEAGKCAVRTNRNGELFTRTATQLAAVNLDPVEKKPLFHLLPGTMTFSVGSLGCNFFCKFCQNSDISQYSKRWGMTGQEVTPELLVETAIQYKAASISYTYNEPTVFFELMQPSAAIAHEKGLRNIMVSNGYMSKECFAELDGLIDAANFDLKSFSDDFYRDLCGARLKPVLQTIERTLKSGWWVELTTLLIGGLNDSDAELDSLAAYIAQELGADVPWHVSRFRPAYKMMDRPQTDIRSLERALEAGYRHGLKYVYAGNVAGHDSESTFCPACKGRAIQRYGFSTEGSFGGVCPHCGEKISGVWS